LGTLQRRRFAVYARILVSTGYASIRITRQCNLLWPSWRTTKRI